MRTTVVLATLVLTLAGCDTAAPPQPPPVTVTTGPSASPGVSASVSAGLAAHPLRFPTVAAGSDCPTTPRTPWTGTGQASAVLGEGPVYPVADYFSDGTTLDLRTDDRELDGSYTKKVRWIGAGYTGPVLVRARRIDADGAASVKFSNWGVASNGGYYADLAQPTNDLPAITRVAGPGCYAYQVDGSTFSTTIVFRAVLA